MTRRRLLILPSSTYFCSTPGAWASVTSASPRAARASACPVPTEMVFTLSPLCFSNIGTRTSSRPESCVLVVVERMTTLDWARAAPVGHVSRAASSSQSPAIDRIIMACLRGAGAARRSRMSICAREHTGWSEHSQRGGPARPRRVDRAADRIVDSPPAPRDSVYHGERAPNPTENTCDDSSLVLPEQPRRLPQDPRRARRAGQAGRGRHRPPAPDEERRAQARRRRGSLRDRPGCASGPERDAASGSAPRSPRVSSS